MNRLDLVALIAETLEADTWTEPSKFGPEWHKRFPHWLAVRAATLLADKLLEHVPGLALADKAAPSG